MNKALREARKAAGLTQADLDQIAGLTRGTTYELESGRTETPAYDTGTKILAALRRHGVKGAQLDRVFPVEVGK